MCFGPHASPPPPPVTDHLASSERLTLVSADGIRVAARLATTDLDDAPGVLLLPDVRGLHAYYEALAEAVADAGAHALAIDLYPRTAGAEYRGEDFDYARHRAQVADAQIRADARTAIATLRETGATRIFSWGFCFGGRASFLQASEDDVDGVIGFYGWPTRQEEGGTSPLLEAEAGRVRVPVLAVYGGADAKIGADDRDRYESALSTAGVEHQTVVYDGAPHSFFDRAMDEHGVACADAWERVLTFIGLR